jgi:hypothetical protein
MPEFTALKDIPSFLGHNAHGRLEELLGTPVASDDSSPLKSDQQTGHKPGLQLGEVVGREREFTRNLAAIRANMQDVAARRDVPETQLWDEVTEILIGSGIGQPMHRTLERPVGGSYGARVFVDNSVRDNGQGVALVVRENIANWGARRHDKASAWLGSLSRKALSQVELVIYAGSGRQYKGAELWRPELEPFITLGPDDEKICSLTESTAAEQLHVPRMKALLGELGVSSKAEVHTVGVDDPKASGDAVTGAIAGRHGDRLKDMLIVEAGNAPAGYTQLSAALVLAQELGIEPDQYLAITDGVEIQHPDHFNALDLPNRSKVQNAATALNSLNGWLQTIVRVNEHMLARRSAA